MTYTLLRVLPKKDYVSLSLLPCNPQKDKQDEEKLSLSFEDYRACGIFSVGEELTEETVNRLRHGERRLTAVKKALRILAASDNSQLSLYKKLRQRGTEHLDAIYAVRQMVSSGYLCENEQLPRLILRYAEEKLFGRARILHELKEKGYRREDILLAIDSLTEAGALDFNLIKEKLYEKKIPQSSPEWSRLCMRHGFTDDLD